MKEIAAFFCLVTISFTVMAEEFLVNTSLSKGRLELKNKDGVFVQLGSGEFKIKVKDPSALRSPVRWVRQEKVLEISDSTNVFAFRIPKSHIKDSGEFSVHKDHTEQNAHTVSRIDKFDYTSNELEKSVSCQYQVMIPALVSDGDGTSFQMQPQYFHGRRNALVQEGKWTEILTIEISNDSGFMELTTHPKPRTAEKILKELSSCR